MSASPPPTEAIGRGLELGPLQTARASSSAAVPDPAPMAFALGPVGGVGAPDQGEPAAAQPCGPGAFADFGDVPGARSYMARQGRDGAWVVFENNPDAAASQGIEDAILALRARIKVSDGTDILMRLDVLVEFSEHDCSGRGE